MVSDRPCGFEFDFKSQPCSKADCSKQSQVILIESLIRVTDGSDDACLEIILPTDVVDNLVFDGVFKQTVDGEVSPLGIMLCIGERHAIRPTPVGIAPLGSEGCHLDVTVHQSHQHHAKGFTDKLGVSENLPKLRWRC